MTSLWGEIPLNEKILTPKAILEAQAHELTTHTNGRLEGRVEVESRPRISSRVTVRLFIFVPALNNYSYEVCGFNYPIVELYPCKVSEPEWPDVNASNEEELISMLEGILQSDRVKRAIRGLLSEARA